MNQLQKNTPVMGFQNVGFDNTDLAKIRQFDKMEFYNQQNHVKVCSKLIQHYVTVLFL